MKKLTSILLALLMALTLLPTAVFAEGTAGTWPKADENGVYTLTSDVTLSQDLKFEDGGNYTIDLGGKTLTFSNSRLRLFHGTLTIKNGTITGASQPINVYGGSNANDSNYSVLNLESGTTVNGDYGVCVFAKETHGTSNRGFAYGAVVNLNGATVKGSKTAVFVQGYIGGTSSDAEVMKKDNIATVNINSGTTITATGEQGIAVNGLAKVNVYDGASITGREAIGVKRGILNVNGGTLKATGNKIDPATANHNGTEATGAAISVTSTYSNYGAISVNVSGGTIESVHNAAVYQGHSVSNNAAIAYSDDVKVNITGGTFTSGDGVPTVYIADKITSDVSTYTTKVISGGTFNDPCALNFAKSGANVTIKLDKDMTENVVVPAGVTATLDLSGKKLTNDTTNGTAHTITVNKDATLTIKGNGTVDNVSHGKAALYNMGTVTLNGGTYTRSAETGNSKTDAGDNSFYNIVNYGTMAINDGVTVEQNGGYSSMVVNGYQNQKQTKYAATPTMTIAGGIFKGGLNTIKNDDNGNLTITGGTFENYEQACVQNHHVAAISGGTYTSTNKEASAVLNCGIKGCGAVAADVHELTISGGTFDGALVKTAGNLTVTGGTFSTSPAKYLPANSYATTYANGEYTVRAKSAVDAGATSDNNTSVVEIETGKTENVTIPNDAIESGKELTVNGTDGTNNTNNTVSVTLNEQAVGTVAEAGDLTLTVTTKEGKDSTNVANENKAAYTEATKNTSTTNAVVVSIDLKNSNGTNVFTDGADGAYAIVTVPYKAGLKNVTVHHLGATGAVTKLTSANNADLTANNTFYYDSSSGVITMRLAHFSQYLLNGTTAGTPYRPRPVGTGTTTTTTTGKAQSPTTFDAGIAIYGVMAVSSVLGMGYMGKKKFF